MDAELSRLAVEVEGAKVGNREIDHAVFDALYDPETRDIWTVPLSLTMTVYSGSRSPAKFSTSLDAVVALIRETLPGLSYELHASGFGGAWARLHDPKRQPGFGADFPRADAPTAAQALLAAALRAKAAIVDDRPRMLTDREET